MTSRRAVLSLLLGCAIAPVSLAAPGVAQQQPPSFRVLRAPTTAVAQRPIVDAALREIVPPPSIASRQRAPSLTLRAAPDSQTIRSLQVTRQLQLSQVRAAPLIQLGNTRVDMAPVLANQRALFNIADRLRSQPQIADVLADDTQFYEVQQGLIVRNFIRYRVKPGACTDAGRAALLSRAGVGCATPLSPSARAAAFANPRDPHYIADPWKRAAALSSAASKSATIDAELTKQVADIRASLANPTKRGAYDSELGPAESARLATLSDDQLKAEIVNSGDIAVEQTLFVPKLAPAGPVKLLRAPPLFGVAAGAPPAPAAPTPAPPPPPTAKPDPVAHTPIEERIVLTGFTLGRDYEWKQRIEKTIKMCLIGCKHTYYAEVYAGFSYGFGLRFPIQIDGVYDYQNGAARLTTNVAPIDGNVAQYAATGLPSGQLFGGKELVAQVSGHAGAGYDLPFIPNESVDIPIGFDLTDYLTGDFAHGQVKAPLPGAANPPKLEKIFDSIDLIGGAANFGVLGAQVFPAVKIELTSDKLTLNLHDFVNNSDTRFNGGQQVTMLGVDHADQSSRFSIGDPIYNLGFLLTPGLDARLFVDIAVWSHNWDFPVWFPQFAVELPPGGADFGCHAGTVCSRGYRYSPTMHEEASAAEIGFESDLQKWGQAFDAKWLPECVDDTCRLGIKFVRQGTIYSGRHKYAANNNVTMTDMLGDIAEAQSQAKQLVDEAQQRQTATAAKSFGVLIQAVWSKQCSDKICLDKVAGIVKFEVLEMNAQQKLHPDMSTTEILGQVGKIYAPIYQKEIDASKARAAAAAAAAPPAVKTMRAPSPVMRVRPMVIQH